MNVAAYYKSLTQELEAVKHRVRHFIANKHWLTDGEWREGVLRAMMTQRLPSSVKIGRGFVITKNGPTTQCDILIYRSDRPVLFREGDLAFVTPDAAVGVIEVKANATRQVVSKALTKLAAIGRKLGPDRDHCCLGLFSYETDVRDHEWLLSQLRDRCKKESQTVNFMNLGCSTFVRYWNTSPNGDHPTYRHWHSYDLTDMSAGYFIANVLDFVSPESIASHSKLWFPEDSKEIRLVERMAHATAPAAP